MINFAQIGILGSRVFDSDYQAILDQATALGYTLPGIDIQIAQNELLQLMKLNGYWTKLDLFYMFKTGDSGLSDFATINWKAPTSFQISKVNSPSFDGDGFTGNSTTSYLSTGYNPSTNATNFSQNSASVFTYVNAVGSPQDNTNAMWGSDGVVGNLIGIGASTANHRLNDSANLPSAIDLSGTGYKAMNRPDASNVNGYSETTKTDVSSSSNAVTSATLVICRFNIQYGNCEHSMFGVGSSMTETEHNQVRLDYLTYVAAL